MFETVDAEIKKDAYHCPVCGSMLWGGSLSVPAQVRYYKTGRWTCRSCHSELTLAPGHLRTGRFAGLLTLASLLLYLILAVAIWGRTLVYGLILSACPRTTATRSILLLVGACLLVTVSLLLRGIYFEPVARLEESEASRVPGAGSASS